MPAGSALSKLRDDLLISMDQYNANDLDVTVTGSSGQRAMLAINQALQKIYSLVKDTEVVQTDAESTALATTSGQDHILLSAISDLDDIVSIYDGTNDVNLERITFKEYRRLAVDPSETTGNPTKYCRWGDRILLYPRPDSAITLTTFYVKKISDMTSASDTTSIDAKFDHWILAEARVMWQTMLDASDQATMGTYKTLANESMEIAFGDLGAQYDLADEVDSHWDRMQPPSAPRFTSPAGQ